MKDSYDLDDVLRGVLSGGCVEPYICGFVERLADAGYSFLVTRDYARAAGHLGRWMDACDLKLEGLQSVHLQDFESHLCACPGGSRPGRVPSRRYGRRIRRFMEHLRVIGVAPALPDAQVAELPAPLVGFRKWMLGHRGPTVRTVDGYERLILRLLPALGDEPAVYDAALVRRVVLDEVRGRGSSYAKTIVTALRAFLRFLEADGRCRTHLIRSVPTIPQWTLSSLPRHLESGDVERVIDACDLDKPHGVRDRAILLLLARLGLRAGDIVDMQLNDIDWTAGTLKVRGKSRRETILPLPQDAGDALLRYLTHSRPDTDIDHLFLCSNAPVRPLNKTATVSSIVMLALRRAGLTDCPSQGAHLLRHSAAVTMLRAGVSVDRISTVLRHGSSDMTAYYAKVDVSLLETIAQPWPEGASC